MKYLVSLLAVLLIAATTPTQLIAVRQLPSGAIMIGSPTAKAKLVEYLSFTCPHCAHFVGESAEPLKHDYIAKGLVSVEVRNAVRDRFDFAAALLARCGGPSRFFGNSEALMASQGDWAAKAGAFETANAAKLLKMPPNQSLKLIVRGVGLDAVMKARGFSSAQIDACLISKPDQARILAMTNEAWNIRKIEGTPSFLINGTSISTVGSWAMMEPLLKTALGVN
jgi:protein-disulfide isomerase